MRTLVKSSSNSRINSSEILSWVFLRNKSKIISISFKRLFDNEHDDDVEQIASWRDSPINFFQKEIKEFFVFKKQKFYTGRVSSCCWYFLNFCRRFSSTNARWRWFCSSVRIRSLIIPNAKHFRKRQAVHCRRERSSILHSPDERQMNWF